MLRILHRAMAQLPVVIHGEQEQQTIQVHGVSGRVCHCTGVRADWEGACEVIAEMDTWNTFLGLRMTYMYVEVTWSMEAVVVTYVSTSKLHVAL